MISWCYNGANIPPPFFPSEIFWMFVEASGYDQHSLRACFLVSSVFRHLCGRILFRDIALDREKVDTFIQFGKRSDILQHVRPLSATDPKNPRRIIRSRGGGFSRDPLPSIRRVVFCPGTLTASLLSRLGTATALVLQGCRFWEFEDFVTFIRCFPFASLYPDPPQ